VQWRPTRILLFFGVLFALLVCLYPSSYPEYAAQPSLDRSGKGVVLQKVKNSVPSPDCINMLGYMQQHYRGFPLIGYHVDTGLFCTESYTTRTVYPVALGVNMLIGFVTAFIFVKSVESIGKRRRKNV